MHPELRIAARTRSLASWTAVSGSPTIVKEGNPLQVEMNLLHFRWKFIEEQEANHYFDLDAVITYYIKLQLLEKLFTFNKTEGQERFKALSSISEEKQD